MTKACLALIALLFVAGCGVDGDDTSSQPPASSSTSTAATGEQPGGSSTMSADDCETEQRTLLTGAEAFYAMNGQYPTSTDEMVTAGLLKDVALHYEIDGAATRTDGEIAFVLTPLGESAGCPAP